ncbi:hypothetical protein DL95DRAFT_403027 [Leptodontidium sp. 2 PMI_412]|nr:hypothetical protein DL95DRAFT_403027 [Leptodontidium sp. 2 PMI_412]
MPQSNSPLPSLFFLLLSSSVSASICIQTVQSANGKVHLPSSRSRNEFDPETSPAQLQTSLIGYVADDPILGLESKKKSLHSTFVAVRMPSFLYSFTHLQYSIVRY